MRPKLVVGNWKMNGSLAANAALLAGIAGGTRTVRRPRAPCACRRPICRSARTCWPAARSPGARRTCRAHAGGAYTGEVCGDDAGRFWLPLRDRRPLRAPRLPWREQRAGGAARRWRRWTPGLTPIVCVGETLDAARSRADRRRGRRPARRGAGAAGDDAGGEDRGRLRAGVGDRHRQDRHAGDGAGSACPAARAAARSATPRRRTACRSCTAAA